MSRLLKNAYGPGDPATAREAMPWISSGILTASAVIKAKAGILGGVLVTATDADGDIDVVIWDSATSTTTDDEYLGRVTIAATTTNSQASLAAPSSCGIQATDGIYVQVVAGNCQYIVYYK